MYPNGVIVTTTSSGENASEPLEVQCLDLRRRKLKD